MLDLTIILASILKGVDHIMDKLINFFNEEDGVTAIEYGLIAALIAVVIIAAITLVGDALSNVFTAVAGNVQGALD